MAIIKCPECGQDVSDKATSCPHCGCPINDALEGNFDYINGKKVDVDKINFLLGLGKIVNVIDYLQHDIELDYNTAVNIARTYQEKLNPTHKCETEGNVIKCPTCGSTDVTRIGASEKAVNIALFGLLGNKRKMQFHCNNCKYNW